MRAPPAPGQVRTRGSGAAATRHQGPCAPRDTLAAGFAATCLDPPQKSDGTLTDSAVISGCAKAGSHLHDAWSVCLHMCFPPRPHALNSYISAAARTFAAAQDSKVRPTPPECQRCHFGTRPGSQRCMAACTMRTSEKLICSGPSVLMAKGAPTLERSAERCAKHASGSDRLDQPPTELFCNRGPTSNRAP